MHSKSRFKLDLACHKLPSLRVQGPEDRYHLTNSRTCNFCKRSSPNMAVSIRFLVLVLLTTSNCVQTVKAQASPPANSPQVASPPPADSSQATSPRAESSQASDLLANSSQVSNRLTNSSQASNLLANSSQVSNPPTTPPAMFVFGDSLVDPGNNNFIQSLAKANFFYNGIDYPGGPTGRFCNGRTVVDILCDLLGIPYPPPFLNESTNGSRVLRGVNYASGAGGILDATGANFLNRICMNQQIGYFQGTTLPQLEAQLGTNATAALLASSLVAIVVGSNDYINNYLLMDTDTQSQYTPGQFNILLQSSFSRQLLTLYNSGFRMFYVSGIGPIGCIPHQLAISQQTTCVSSVNAQAQGFNTLIRSMLEGLNTALPDAMFLFVNAYDSLTALINNPVKYGFTVVNQGCCGGGLYGGQVNCQPAATVCRNRAEYVFWDPYHPTAASNLVLANGIYSGGTDEICPINIQQLLAQRQQPFRLLGN